MTYYVYKSTKDTPFISVQKKDCVLIKECKTLEEAKEVRDSSLKNGVKSEQN